MNPVEEIVDPEDGDWNHMSKVHEVVPPIATEAAALGVLVQVTPSEVSNSSPLLDILPVTLVVDLVSSFTSESWNVSVVKKE